MPCAGGGDGLTMGCCDGGEGEREGEWEGEGEGEGEVRRRWTWEEVGGRACLQSSGS